MKKILITVLIIIIVAIVGIGGYFAYQKYFSTNAGWTEYTNDQLMAMVDENWQNEAMFFKARENNLLIVDQGTAPPPRGLIIYDLNTKKKVFQDSYSTPLDITNTTITYWNPTTQKVTVENCSDYVKWTSQGLGTEIESRVSLDLTTLTKKGLGQYRCQPTQ